MDSEQQSLRTGQPRISEKSNLRHVSKKIWKVHKHQYYLYGVTELWSERWLFLTS